MRGVASAFLLGLAFSFGWTPCVGPILGSILALAAGGGNVAAGAGLLLVYALGLRIPFLVIALAANLLLARLSKIHKYLPAIQKAGGVLIAIMGLWMIFTQVGAGSLWHKGTPRPRLRSSRPLVGSRWDCDVQR